MNLELRVQGLLCASSNIYLSWLVAFEEEPEFDALRLRRRLGDIEVHS